jgi:hypothetical protein
MDDVGNNINSGEEQAADTERSHVESSSAGTGVCDPRVTGPTFAQRALMLQLTTEQNLLHQIKQLPETDSRRQKAAAECMNVIHNLETQLVSSVLTPLISMASSIFTSTKEAPFGKVCDIVCFSSLF